MLVRTTNGGATWRSQSTGITGDLNLKNLTLQEVRFVDASRGWIVGSYFYSGREHALILATRDGGAHWRQQGPRTADLMLRSVTFTDAQHGCAVGNHYQGSPAALQRNILTTSDGGASWQLRDSGVSSGLEAVDFADALHGRAVGSLGSVTTTGDGGVTWTSSTLGQHEALVGVAFSDVDHGAIAGGDGSVWRTADGGATWSCQSVEAPHLGTAALIPGGDSLWVLQSEFLGGVPIDCVVQRSQDGGVTWQRPASDLRENVRDLTFVDRLHGWGVGTGGLIVVTNDGGSSWFRQSAPTPGDLSAVEFADTLHGWAVGEDGIITTADGGSNWQSQTVPATGLTALSFTDAAHGWAAGGDNVVFTTDGGATWKASAFAPAGTTDLSSVSFVDAQRGWVGGMHQSAGEFSPTGCVYRTTDGGQSWERDFEGSAVFDLCFVDAEHGWLCQNSPYDGIMRTSDGGLTWTRCGAQVQSQTMRKIDLCDQTHGAAVGIEGTLLQTTDGKVWRAENSGRALDRIFLDAVSILEPGYTWVGGNAGTIMRHPDPYLGVSRPKPARLGRKFTLKCAVSGAAAVRVTVTIRIRNRRNRVVKKLVLKNRESNVTLSSSFVWKLPKGVFRAEFTAKDAVGKSAPGPVVAAFNAR